jgi:hypothetical protein
MTGELAGTTMQELWDSQGGEELLFLPARRHPGIAPGVLRLDELCPVGSRVRRQLVVCLAEMFREVHGERVREGEPSDDHDNGMPGTAKRSSTAQHEPQRQGLRPGNHARPDKRRVPTSAAG